MEQIQTAIQSAYDAKPSEFKDSIFCKNKTLIKNFFKFKPGEIIILFLEKVYSYDEYR